MAKRVIMNIKEEFFKRYEITKSCDYIQTIGCSGCYKGKKYDINNCSDAITLDTILTLEDVILKKRKYIVTITCYFNNTTSMYRYSCSSEFESAIMIEQKEWYANRIDALLSLFLRLPENIIEELIPQVQAVFKENN